MAEEIDFENRHFWKFMSHVTLTLTSDDLECHIIVNVSSTLTNSTIWFVDALCLIVDVHTPVNLSETSIGLYKCYKNRLKQTDWLTDWVTESHPSETGVYRLHILTVFRRRPMQQSTNKLQVRARVQQHTKESSNDIGLFVGEKSVCLDRAQRVRLIHQV